MRDHHIPPVSQHFQHVALDVIAGALCWQQIATPGIVPARRERIANYPGKLASDKYSHALNQLPM